jgi:hypothetical protein
MLYSLKFLIFVAGSNFFNTLVRTEGSLNFIVWIVRRARYYLLTNYVITQVFY